MTTYGPVDRFNHWLAALLFVAIACAGWALYFDSFDQATAGTVRDLHKAFGTLIGVFAIWRVGARMVRGFPPPVEGSSTALAGLARTIHYILLAGVLIMPASGLAKSLFAGRPVDLFGLVTLGSPDIKNEAYAELASTIHFIAAVAVSLAVCLHVLAALKHHFLDRDQTLVRMLRG
jgi:cytochrome b561